MSARLRALLPQSGPAPAASAAIKVRRESVLNVSVTVPLPGCQLDFAEVSDVLEAVRCEPNAADG